MSNIGPFLRLIICDELLFAAAKRLLRCTSLDCDSYDYSPLSNTPSSAWTRRCPGRRTDAEDPAGHRGRHDLPPSLRRPLDDGIREQRLLAGDRSSSG